MWNNYAYGNSEDVLIIAIEFIHVLNMVFCNLSKLTMERFAEFLSWKENRNEDEREQNR